MPPPLPRKREYFDNLMYSETVTPRHLKTRKMSQELSFSFIEFNFIIQRTCSDTTFSSKCSAFFLHSAVCFWCFSSSVEYIAFSSKELKIQNKNFFIHNMQLFLCYTIAKCKISALSCLVFMR